MAVVVESDVRALVPIKPEGKIWATVGRVLTIYSDQKVQQIVDSQVNGDLLVDSHNTLWWLIDTYHGSLNERHVYDHCNTDYELESLELGSKPIRMLDGSFNPVIVPDGEIGLLTKIWEGYSINRGLDGPVFGQFWTEQRLRKFVFAPDGRGYAIDDLGHVLVYPVMNEDGSDRITHPIDKWTLFGDQPLIAKTVVFYQSQVLVLTGSGQVAVFDSDKLDVENCFVRTLDLPAHILDIAIDGDGELIILTEGLVEWKSW